MGKRETQVERGFSSRIPSGAPKSGHTKTSQEGARQIPASENETEPANFEEVGSKNGHLSEQTATVTVIYRHFRTSSCTYKGEAR